MKRILKNKGITLMEIVIAVGLLGAVTLGTGAYLSNSFKDSNKLASKAEVQSQVNALMNKIETTIKMASIPVCDEDNLIIYQVENNDMVPVKFEHQNKEVTVYKDGTEEIKYNHIESLTMELTAEEDGAKITIIGEGNLYKLEATYYTRNTFKNNTPGGGGGGGTTNYYTLTLKNNGVMTSQIDYAENTVVNIKAVENEGYEWDAWYYEDNITQYSTNKSTPVTIYDNITLNAVWKKSDEEQTGEEDDDGEDVGETGGTSGVNYTCPCCGVSVSVKGYCSGCGPAFVDGEDHCMNCCPGHPCSNCETGTYTCTETMTTAGMCNTCFLEYYNKYN